jgi:hypothetical protein
MAAVELFRRQSTKANLTQLVEGTDDAVLSSIITDLTTTGNLYNDGNTVTVVVGGSVTETATLFTGAAMTAINLGTGMGAGGLINIGGSGSTVTVGGDLVVNGTTTSVDSETVLIADNHLYLNQGYTTTVAQTGGLVVNYLPTATGDTSTTGGFATTSTVNTVGAATFSPGDFVQISGAATAGNDGIFEVLTHAGNVMTIDTTPVEDWVQNAFTVDTTDTTAVLTNVTCSIIRAGTDGIWEVGSGSSQPVSFTDLATAAGVTLQQAYDNDAGSPVQITTNSTLDQLDITGTAALRVTATGVDNTVNAGFGFDVDTTGAFRIFGDAASTIQTDGAGIDLSLNSALGRVVIDGGEAATDAVRINASNAAGGIDIDAGTGGITVNTTGAYQLTTTGTTNVLIDAGNNFSIDSAGTGSNLTQDANDAGAAVLTIASTNIGAGTAALDIDADEAITIDSAAAGVSIDGVTASNFTVTGAADLTLSSTAGSVIVSGGEAAADAVQLTASNAAGGITASAGTGGYSIGAADTAAQTNTLWTGGTGAKLVTIGSTAAASSTTIDAGTGGIDIGTGTAAMTVNLGTGGTGAKTVNIGDESVAGSTVTLEAGSTGDITFDARGITTPITLNQTGDINLDAGFTATSLIGALNELFNGVGDDNRLVETFDTTNRAIGEPVIMDGNDSADTAADASALSTTEGFVGIVLTVGATGTVVTSGTASAQIIAGLSAAGISAGDPVFISLTTGRVTTDATAFSPPNDVVYQIGIVKDKSALSATTLDGELLVITLRPFTPVEL